MVVGVFHGYGKCLDGDGARYFFYLFSFLMFDEDFGGFSFFFVDGRWSIVKELFVFASKAIGVCGADGASIVGAGSFREAHTLCSEGYVVAWVFRDRGQFGWLVLVVCCECGETMRAPRATSSDCPEYPT